MRPIGAVTLSFKLRYQTFGIALIIIMSIYEQGSAMASHDGMSFSSLSIQGTPVVAAEVPDRYAGRKIELPGGASLRIPTVPDVDTPLDCASARVHCVPAEFPNLQAAANIVEAGETVVAEPGSHQSFIIEKKGTIELPIRFLARPGAVIDRYPDTEHGIMVRSDFIRGFYSDNIQIVGFTVLSSRGRCLYFTRAISTRPTTGHVISRNRCIDAADHGFYFSQVSYAYIAHNYIVNAGNALQEHGMYFANGGTGNNIVYGNVVAGSHVNGIHCNGDRSVDYLSDGSRGGISGTDGLVSGMIFDSNVILSSGQNGISLDGAQESSFVNNVIAGSNRHAVRGYAIDAAAGPANLVFANNTFVDNVSAVKLTEVPAPSKLTLINNLFVEHAEEEIQIEARYIEAASAIMDRVEFVNSIALNDVHPSFRRTVSLDLRLTNRDARRVLDKGVAVHAGESAPSYDIRGRSRAEMPDIGAFEHSK